MNITYAYIFLAFAIVLEITGTSFVKDTAGFTRWVPSISRTIAKARNI